MQYKYTLLIITAILVATLLGTIGTVLVAGWWGIGLIMTGAIIMFFKSRKWYVYIKKSV